MSTPNAEQRPAIEHRGGVLLKAGAGSGKTFVLVEHAIYLTRQWRLDWEKTRATPFTDFIGEHYSSTVLMTFTKLAAGEILVRLTARFQRQSIECEESEQSWWLEALSQIERLTVTTIDGFFYRLVRRGFFPELPPDLEIIMDPPRQRKIMALFDSWWDLRSDKLDAEAARDAAMNRTALAQTLHDIFNDPSLRDSWMQFEPNDAHPSKLDWLAQELVTVAGWFRFLSLDAIDVPEEARKKNNKWVALADALNQRPKELRTWQDVKDWGDFARSDVGSTRLVLGSSKDLVGAHFDAWRDFKDSIKNWSESYAAYEAHFEGRILPWLRTLHELVRYIDRGLSVTEGLTYGDLEYHVLRSVRDPLVAQKISREFTYFIVDEFQDTSRVQYDVLRLITRNQSQRLFCVGDAKQAIYGFRGGELQVFLDVEKSAGVTTLPLRANYRSRSKIVSFNNAIFHRLFPLGIGWVDDDPHAVEMESQTVPEISEVSAGAVKVLSVQLPDILDVDEGQADKKSPKWTSRLINQAEGEVVAEYVREKLASDFGGAIAILYKRLAPAGFLMTSLIQRGVGFTAQAKIAFKDDPISGILLCLIEDVLGLKEKVWSSFMISGYLQLLRIDPPAKLSSIIESFTTDVQAFGTTLAFDLFLARLRISNSMYSGNWQELREILQLSGSDLELIALKIRQKGGENWSADFRFGENPHRVIIQTSHGSKGLEYDVVVVAGLVTNGFSRPRQDWIGSIPGAALWVAEAASRKKLPTPQFEFEKALSRQKDFAESKRLFYVACTRAKQELVFVRFEALEKQLTIGEMSWAKGLEVFLESADENLYETIPRKLGSESFSSAQTAKPFFHLNPLGLAAKAVVHAPPDYGVTSELAVTRLNSLWECPRKFYYQQVLGLDAPELERLTAFVSEDEFRPLSSSERGSAIHLGLSQAVAANFVLPLEWVNHRDRSKMEWALSEVREKCSEHRLSSEQPMKFPLFGFMISGIPDLVAYGETVEVWDYKTGRPDATTQLKYWQQLMIYALGHWENGLVSRALSIVLRLCYVDTQELLTKEVRYEEAAENLLPIWGRLARLHEVDLAHCPKCPYQTLCPR